MRWIRLAAFILFGLFAGSGAALAQGVDGYATIAAPSGGGGGTGRLIYEPQCVFTGTGVTPQDTVSLTQEMWIDGRWTAYGSLSSKGSVQHTLSTTLPATENNQNVDCTAYVEYWNEYGDYGTGSGGTGVVAPGAGPARIRITGNVFIARNWVDRPFSPSRIFGGDSRGFNEFGSSRLRRVMHIGNTGLTAMEPEYGIASTGETREYDRETSLIWVNNAWIISHDAESDTQWGGDMKLRWDYAQPSSECLGQEEGAFLDGPTDLTSRAWVSCTMEANDPLMPGAPYANLEFRIQLKFGYGGVAYTVSGCHDGWPTTEIYIHGSPAYQRNENGNEWSLFGSCDTNISASGFVAR